MDRTFMLIGVVAAFIGVGFGAFGAHSLRGRTSPEMLAVFETGVRYQMYHAFAILITALALSRFDAPLIRWAGWLFTAGIIIFSGSLYALVLTGTRASVRSRHSGESRSWPDGRVWRLPRCCSRFGQPPARPKIVLTRDCSAIEVAASATVVGGPQ